MKIKIKALCLVFLILVLQSLSAQEDGAFYISAGGQGNLFFGSSISDSGFDGKSYYFTEEGTILIPVYKPGIGGGWFLDAGMTIPGLPIFIEIGAGQSFHSGTWTLSSGTWAGIDYGDISAPLILSSVQVNGVWKLRRYRGVDPEFLLGAGFCGVYSKKGGLTEEGSSEGGFGGFLISAGGGCTYPLGRGFELLGRLKYNLAILTTGIWGSNVATVDEGISEHGVELILGGRYWLPF